MSTSLLYHAFGVRGYRHEKTEFVEGDVVFHVCQEADSCRSLGLWVVAGGATGPDEAAVSYAADRR